MSQLVTGVERSEASTVELAPEPLPAPQPGHAPESELLRFAAVGSVDDGKSTLIGRLLYDTKQLFEDHIEALASASRRRGAGEMDLSLLTDGLRAEREQGITIDVAYRYAATPRRKFIIADCPGHLQYTRNMATGASNADLALVVVDASVGVRDQTRRHLCIAAILGVRHVLVAVNKMDLVGWDPSAYQVVAEDLANLSSLLGVKSLQAVPVSALDGDNVAERSQNCPWYSGPTVLDALHQADAGVWSHEEDGSGGARLPVQIVARRPGGGRCYSGLLSGDRLAVGDEVVVLSSGLRSRIAEIWGLDGPKERAVPAESVSVTLADDLDVSRGDLIAARDGAPHPVRDVEASVCWFGQDPLRTGGRYRIKHTTLLTRAEVIAVDGRLDVSDLRLVASDQLADNEIGIVRFLTAAPLAVDPYRRNRVTGSFIVVDEVTNVTVGAAMVGRPHVAG